MPYTLATLSGKGDGLMSNFLIKDIVRTVLHVPFHERCADAMEVYGPGWAIVELIEVETEGGVTGVGETIQG